MATVGITDYAQSSLGDITFVQLPKVGATLKAGEGFGVVESVKAASDLYAPVGGTVTAVNPALEAAPETLNRRLNPTAALCVPSTGGAVQTTVRLLAVPCASDGVAGAYGAAAAVVRVFVADQALVPAAFELCTCTS